MKHLSQNIRVPIEQTNPCIKRDELKCIKCGACARVCKDFADVLDNYDLTKTKKAVCVGCGQCVQACPMNSLTEKQDYQKIKALMQDKSKIFVVSTAPAVRVALGDEFNMPFGALVEGKMISALKKLGFNYVYDINFGADLTIMEEATELVNRLNLGTNKLPQFSSCCPSWVRYAETFFPEFIPNLSTCKSPISMQGATIKTYLANKLKLNPESVVNVVVTPCTAKKMEIKRSELNSAGKYLGIKNLRDNDFVITTHELALWIKENKINFNSLKEKSFDKFLGSSSGAGALFGVSGGVTEAVVRTAYKILTGKEPSANLLQFKDVRGISNIKSTTVKIKNKELKLAVVSGLQNAHYMLNQIKNGEQFDFVEFMACPGGCIGGGGQPKTREKDIALTQRSSTIYNKDKLATSKYADENAELQKLYKEYYGAPASKLAKKLLHTKFKDRSNILKEN